MKREQDLLYAVHAVCTGRAVVVGQSPSPGGTQSPASPRITQVGTAMFWVPLLQRGLGKELGFSLAWFWKRKAYPLSRPTDIIFMHTEVVEQLMLPEEKLRLGLQQSLHFLYCELELLWASVSPLGQQGVYIIVFTLKVSWVRGWQQCLLITLSLGIKCVQAFQKGLAGP